jgi:molybdenum cofactor cytidylyltransferase
LTGARDNPGPTDRAGISVAIVILAAGRSSRVSPAAGHKLLSTFEGIPLVRRVTMRALNSHANNVDLVTGFRHSDIAHCLEGLDITIARNPGHPVSGRRR